MDDGMEDDQIGDLLTTVNINNHTPPHRKTQSYSQQLGNPQLESFYNTGRKHSLDEGRIPKSFDRFYDDSSDEDVLYPYGGGGLPSGRINSVRISGMDPVGDFLEGRSSDSSGELRRTSLPEFVGNGGGKGIFRVPLRAAIHPGRPPGLELRPHPFRETQVGGFLRSIACTETQLWAGQESGLRFWNFCDVYTPGCGVGGKARRGDEDTAPFYESAPTVPTTCLVVDAGNRLIWTGHKDGKVRSWKMDQPMDGNPFREVLTWYAHRGPILSMIMSSYGDLWTGGEGGVIKVWPWESIEKSLSLTVEERHMAALLVERSYIDLKSQVTVNGVCSVSGSDVKYLLVDNARAKVWSAGQLSFALWDARTRELLKVFNVDGQIENRVDLSSGQDSSVEDEMKQKLVSVSKKEKSQSSISFLQRSRNALMGAADAVRRVAAKGAFGEEKRTEALVLAADGMIWTGCSNGVIVQWDGNGNRLQDFQYHSSSVQCFCALGARIWVGYISGTIQVFDLEGKLLGGWVAHSSPVIKMAVGAGYVFSLANHGGIRGWSIKSPSPVDKLLRLELERKELQYKRLDNVRILTGTWNVGQGRASHDSLISWLGSAATDVGIVVVGLQEVEMGAGFLAMSAAKETVGLEGSSMGQWWLDTIGKTLDEGSTFERVGSRQLAGLLIAIWVRSSLSPCVGDVDAAAVPCGFGRAIGNKGAVGLRMRVHDRVLCFVNCHLAAHLEAVNRRNADFDHIYRTMTFTRPNTAAGMVMFLFLCSSLACCTYLFWLLYSSGLPLVLSLAAGVSSATQLLRAINPMGVQFEDGRPELSEADMVVFLGDFNYRLHGISYDEARDFVSQRCFDWLRERDQLRGEMKAGKVFQGMREGIIRFPPTYKFERHQTGLGGYDSSEKKRIPAWCDRILYRDSRSASVSECSLECPVVASILQYEACMDVNDSDHKPVRCIYSVDIAHVDESIKRQEYGEIMRYNETIRSMLEELNDVPETIVSTNNIILQNQDTSILRITNKSMKDRAMFEINCAGQSTVKEGGQASEHVPRGSLSFPHWLEVTPATGIIEPGQIVEVAVHHEEFHALEEFVDGVPQNSWCEDSRDKEVILVVNVRGSCTIDKKCHRIRVRHCFPSKALRTASNSSDSKRFEGKVLHRADFRQLSSSCDVVNDLRSLQNP